MEKLDMKRRPSGEYRYFLHDPEGDGMMYFRTQAERDKNAAESIIEYLYEGEWGDVECVAVGVITHIVQMTDKQIRPADEDLDEEMRDSEGTYWPDDIDWRGNYTLVPIG